MVIDTSALLAILFNESDAEYFESALDADTTRLISAASLLETAIVVDVRLGEAGGRELDLLCYEAQITIVPFTAEQAEIARYAYRTYGKGRHPAGLNYGDCFAYALAKILGEPLLFKGNDFFADRYHAVEVSPTIKDCKEAEIGISASSSLCVKVSDLSFTYGSGRRFFVMRPSPWSILQSRQSLGARVRGKRLFCD